MVGVALGAFVAASPVAWCGIGTFCPAPAVLQGCRWLEVSGAESEASAAEAPTPSPPARLAEHLPPS